MLFQKPKPEFLYLYQHVPKCAGSTIIHHLDQQLKTRALSLERKFQTKHEVWADIVKTQPNLDTLVSIHGHRVFYGLHHLVDREARYYTFLRDPVSRVISLYNFWVDSPARREAMYKEGKLISFREFLDTDFAQNNMIRFLYHAIEGDLTPGNWIESITDHHLSVAKSFLDRCWFIGFVETFAEDFRYLSSNMGITYNPSQENRSKKYFELSQDPTVKDRILETNRFDIELFEYAKELRYGTQKAIA
ncbi:sulfotransferase family 2 domain-containing protein [Pseudanabaenaceae cyanobacterium LEGE 13415]|nr:sulfotransferase family 2 domain-containing protein [Pseudanabaenaceae cyanobacterium LEGE 13415]